MQSQAYYSWPGSRVDSDSVWYYWHLPPISHRGTHISWRLSHTGALSQYLQSWPSTGRYSKQLWRRPPSKQKLYCCYRIWHRFCDTEVLHWHKIQNLFIFLSLFMFFGFCCSQCCCKYQKIKRRNNSALKIIWMFLISIFITVGYLGVAWMSVRQDSI